MARVRGSDRPGETSLFKDYDHPACEKDDPCSPGPVQRALLTTRPDGRGAAIAGARPLCTVRRWTKKKKHCKKKPSYFHVNIDDRVSLPEVFCSKVASLLVLVGV